MEGEEGQVWAVGLPPAPAAADRSLADREGRMGGVERHLEDLADNLDFLLQKIAAKLERGKFNIRSAFVKTTMGPAIKIM